MGSPDQQDRLAVLAGLYAGLAFGLFWLRIRAIEKAGFEGPWAISLLAGLPLVLVLPLAWRHRAAYFKGPAVDLLGGLVAGAAFALYGVAFLYTEVVRAILLFYAMPLWGFLLGWAILGDRITWYRWAAIGIGLIGLAVVFGAGAGVPLPRNLGDWCAALSGFLWAVASLLILMQRRVSALVHGINFFAVAAVLSVLAGLAAGGAGLVARPDWNAFLPMAVWAVPVAVVLILPAGLATVYAPTRLNPGVCGLLFMAEVVVAAVTAALWAGEPLSVREAVGLVLIVCAGLVEPAAMTWRRRRNGATDEVP